MMDAEFWLQRWQEGRIGFHQQAVTPLLEQHWSSVGVAPGARVFVPLAGKTLDLLWLASRGHRVLGVELSQLAVEQFFAENQLTPKVLPSPHGVRHVAGEIELLCGDAFTLDADALADCSGVYDRAALIALPAQMRQRYASNLYSLLPRGCRGLLVTLEYQQHEKAGPPFSVTTGEVRALYEPGWAIEELERRYILAAQPQFAADGVTSLHTVAWRLIHR